MSDEKLNQEDTKSTKKVCDCISTSASWVEQFGRERKRKSRKKRESCAGKGENKREG